MKIKNNFIEKLVEEKNPFTLLWNYMTDEIWKYQNDLESFYGQEKKMKDFELFLHRTFDEVYTDLLPKYCTGKGYKIKLKHPIIFLDSFSIREAILLKEKLKEKTDCKLTYSFSAIPSDTKSYKEKIDYSKLKKNNKHTEIKDMESLEIEGDEKIIWSDFPDALLESLSEGKTILGTVTETYKKLEKLVLKLIEQLNHDKIEIMSDHGYVRHQGAYTFSMDEKDQKKVRKVLKGRRKESISEAEKLPKGMKKFVVEYNDFYMAKGRYVWTTIGGKYSKLQHGGVSLIECMTPRLIIEG
ncbi:hypothetical protein AKJ49_01575 [candidate division MSBL1 archaeon SCGC-AAA382A03]|uniref:PglZ domain-containing protein n=1 Tax=candidate division MSBL1 archaeon SCGC-AAA382A03 TaxID=1698278 RepID=A0A133VER0_9EURY|nr:hypothetical protein AKJ49_01575 [candidate division MSBL1 archaeon SCGC-AAA382A03]